MIAEGHKVASLHGAKDGAERDKIIDSFRAGNEKVLITTNVVARGIDIMQVNVVVNYDLPMMSDKSESNGSYDPRFETPDLESYIHRIGTLSLSKLTSSTLIAKPINSNFCLPQVVQDVSDAKVFQSTSYMTRRVGRTCIVLK